MLITIVWLSWTVGGGLIWIVAAMFGSSLVDSNEVEGPVRFTLVGGTLGVMGLGVVWALRRTRAWLVAALVFAIVSMAAAAAYLLDF